jgi:Tfp pilus assembly protein PilF
MEIQMAKTAIEVTLRGFVDYFGVVHRDMPNYRFAWMLGAGASDASGIPLGADLVDEWLREMHSREVDNQQSLKTWATAERLEIKNFDWKSRASFYPEVFQRRFRLFPEEGYAYLERLMAGREPSPGYSILAAALASQPPRHNVVITTNFDNLVADALSIYTDTCPLVVGHESLTGFVNASLRRPLICKIHRDLLFAPQNDRRSLRRLHDSWGNAIRTLFQHYTPLFIGYGGNDDTLMDLLESLEPDDIRGPLVWCYYEKDKPSERVVSAVADLNGFLVAAPDFDLLMVLLGDQMGITVLDAEIGNRATARTRRYRDRIIQLHMNGHSSAAKAFASVMNRSGGWWREFQKTQTTTDRKKRREAFLHAVQTEKSSVLYGLYANFMRDEFRNFKVAEDLYDKALDLDPDDATITGDYALLMAYCGKYDKAQEKYEKALTLDPRNAIVTNSFANFLWYLRIDPERADALYRRAATLDPKSITIARDLAEFVWNYVKSWTQADVAYRLALKLGPRDVRTLTSYAGFLLADEKYDDALRVIEDAKVLNADREIQLAAVLALYEAIIRTARRQDITNAVYRLDNILKKEFPRGRWRFDRVLDLVKKSVADRYEFFSGLAERILKSTIPPSPPSSPAASADELGHVFERWGSTRGAGSSRPPSG